MSRFVKIVIAISFSLNLLLAGLLIGSCLGRMDMDPRRHMEEMLSGLPTDKHALFEQTMHKVEKDTAPLRQQLKDARSKSVEILKTEPFNKQAYMAQMQVIHELHGKMMQHMVEAMAGVAEKFTPEERAALAEMLRRPPPPPPPAD